MTEENRTYITHLKVTDVPWHRLTTAYGRGTEFPAHLAVLEQMRDLASVKGAGRRKWTSVPIGALPCKRMPRPCGPVSAKMP